MVEDPKSDSAAARRLIAGAWSESTLHLETQTEAASPIQANQLGSDPGPGNISAEGASRYQIIRLLGRGGMGEVNLCIDKRIGREVALKVIRPDRLSRSEVRRRFLREARVQGQLEHPAIVPVHDLGVMPTGETYFTMKYVRGVSLSAVLEGLRKNDEALCSRFSRRRLLTAFNSVCLAIDFAHRRGVLHRDLKPGNLMLGDFGEVYLLDWGLARLGSSSEEERDNQMNLPEDAQAETAAGQILGTPGYMSPEQVTGGPLDERTDIYALGAILFELLTLERLHPQTKVPELLRATTAGAEARASVRKPEAEVPPELEAICVKATALDPNERFSSARSMQEALERFLDGDRDLTLRRQMATSHAEAAEEAAAKALLETGESESRERDRALREVGQALGLDPQNPKAVRTLAKLLTQPPREIPAEASQAIEHSAGEIFQSSDRSLVGFSTIFYPAFLLLFLWMGIRDWLILLLAILWGVGAGLLNLLPARRRWSKGRMGMLTLALILCSSLPLSRIFGPLVLLPSIAIMTVMASIQPLEKKLRVALIATSCLMILFPFLLEQVGVLPPSYEFSEGKMIILPQLLWLPEAPTLLMLLLMSLGLIVTAALTLGRVRDLLTESERKVRLQAWQLSRLVPEEARREEPTKTNQPTTTYRAGVQS